MRRRFREIESRDNVIIVRVRKEALEQFVYVPLNKYGVEYGDRILVEFWCNGKRIHRTYYMVQEKELRGRKYKFLWIRLPWFSSIRAALGSGWRPYFDLEIKIYPKKKTNYGYVGISQI